MIAMVVTLNTVEVTYLIAYDKEMVDNSTCAHAQKLYLGAIYCLFYTICVMQAYKNGTFFRQITKFVDDGDLPNRKVHRRIQILGLFIFLFSLANWIVYTVYQEVYTAR